MELFEQSNLWKKSLANQGADDPCEKARTRLRDAFLKTRKVVEPLVAQISSELPALTVHDITHLDSLWNVVDIIAGNEFEINPAEAFILGMAFLFHDAATSTFAFQNGIDEVRETMEWKDFVAQNKFSEEDLIKGTPEYQVALFDTLRILHPKQAEKLLSQSWKDINGDPRWLIEDIELRNYYGLHIGKISSSHGKNAAVAEQEWANAASITPHCSLGLGAGYSDQWKVDSLKVAMLLRCVDAAHIDSRRAPDMVACLFQPQGDSKDHWTFQNHLGDLGINNNNELYWTGQPFDEKDSDAWWLCYKTAQMIDQEIRTANCILENNNRKPFRATGVLGAQDIAVFQKSVPVQGWEPIDVNFQISSVSEVIEKFGGKKLYGDKPWLVLRELIQNAADAIRALRNYRTNLVEHGRIDICLDEIDGAWWLHVQDNGIGMSRFVLTNVLLDFGKSLWRDDSIRSEWPGLASNKGFESIGQFGIGFFSIFMLGREVKVTTWRYGDAEDAQTTLHLRRNTKATPILLFTPSEERLAECGTKVSVRLSNGRSSLLKEVSTGSLFDSHSPKREMTLVETAGALAPALDINLWCHDKGDRTQVIYANDWEKLSPSDLLKRIAPLFDEKYHHHHTDIFDVREQDGTLVGRAGLGGINYSEFGHDIGVLVHQGITMGRCGLSGVLVSGNNSDLARNTAVPICSLDALLSWAKEIKAGVKNEFSKSNKLLSLGLYDDSLKITWLGDEVVSSSNIIERLKDPSIEEISILIEDVECPTNMPQEKFEDNFIYDEDVFVVPYLHRRETFGMDSWINTLLPETQSEPRKNLSAVRHAILQAWLNAVSEEKYRRVGEVEGEEVSATCLVFSK